MGPRSYSSGPHLAAGFSRKADGRLMVLTFAALYGLGGTLVLLTLPFAGRDVHVAGLVAPAVVALGVSVALLGAGRRLPLEWFRLLPGFGAVLVTVVSLAAPAATFTAYLVLHLWVVCTAAYFFGRRVVVAHLVLVTGLLGFVLMSRGQTGAPVAWAVSAATLAIMAVALYGLRRHGRALERALAASERRYRTIVEMVDGGVWCVGDDGVVTFVNTRAAELVGLPPDRIVGRHWTESIRAVEGLPGGTAQAAAGSWRRDLRIVRHDGTALWAIASSAALLDADGEPDGKFAMVVDITARKAAEAALKKAEEQFRGCFDASPIGMAICSIDEGRFGRFVRVNAAMSQITGYDAAELLRLTFTDITHPADRETSLRAAHEFVDGVHAAYAQEKRYVHASGRQVWVQANATMVRDEHGRPLHVLSQVQDITLRKEQEAALRELAERDPLTGLLNRRRFTEELDRALSATRRYGERGALLVMDLDNFKLANDTAGHAVGDGILIAVGRVLREVTRTSDVVARIGGDEFAVLLPRADRRAAGRAAEKLVRTIRDRLVSERLPEPVTASVGAAIFDDASTGYADDVLRQADCALYAAKHAGRASWRLYDTGMDFRRRERLPRSGLAG